MLDREEILAKAYNDCINPNRTSYANDKLYKKLEKELENIL